MKNIKRTSFIIIGLTLLYISGFTYTLRTDTPAGSDDPREADDRMREIKAAFVERLDVDHFFTASATSTYDHADTGKHEQITFLDYGTPTQVSGYAHLWMVADELWWQDDTNTKIQLTESGYIEYQSISDVNNNTYIVAVDAAGTGTVDLIKADANDVAFLPDGTRLATIAAPTTTAGVANKKYVDDQIAAIDDIFGTLSTDDSESNAFLKAHAYSAPTAGIVNVHAVTANELIGYVGSTTDPVGAGTLIIRNRASVVSGITFPVKKGQYWEITLSSDTPTITWTPIGTLSKPVDQD